MSTKYETGDRRLVEDDIVLTDHAIMRYRQRTPHDCSVNPRVAWRRGEFVKHPEVAESDHDDRPLQQVRVYKHGDEWGVAFLVAHADDAHISGRCSFVVATVIHLAGFEHGPSRAYLHSHGPHDGGRP